MKDPISLFEEVVRIVEVLEQFSGKNDVEEVVVEWIWIFVNIRPSALAERRRAAQRRSLSSVEDFLPPLHGARI